jgi:hypothetical protein
MMNIRFCQQGNWFWQNKYNAVLIKSYGIIASKYATLLNIRVISKIYTKQKIYWHNRMKLINIQE